MNGQVLSVGNSKKPLSTLGLKGEWERALTRPTEKCDYACNVWDAPAGGPTRSNTAASAKERRVETKKEESE